MRDRGPAASPGAALFFVLLAATLVIGTLVVRARTPDLVLEVTSIVPRVLIVDEPRDEARVTLFVRESDPRAEISIVDGNERVVRTLAGAIPLPADREVVYRWDGRDDAGRPVARGRYRVRVRLPERDRDMIWPRRISVERPPGDRGRRTGEAER